MTIWRRLRLSHGVDSADWDLGRCIGRVCFVARLLFGFSGIFREVFAWFLFDDVRVVVCGDGHLMQFARIGEHGLTYVDICVYGLASVAIKSVMA